MTKRDERDDRIRELFAAAREIDRAWAPAFDDAVDRDPHYSRPRRSRLVPALALGLAAAALVAVWLWPAREEAEPLRAAIEPAVAAPPPESEPAPARPADPLPPPSRVQPPTAEPLNESAAPAPPHPAAGTRQWRPGSRTPRRSIPEPVAPTAQAPVPVLARPDPRPAGHVAGASYADATAALLEEQSSPLLAAPAATGPPGSEQAGSRSYQQLFLSYQAAVAAGTITNGAQAQQWLRLHQRESLSESYAPVQEHVFLTVMGNPLSTFSVDVDTASYTNVRRFLEQDRLPPRDAVRIEELINYFDYDYSQPSGDDPLSVDVEIASCPWKPEHRLARIGVQGRELPRQFRPGANLVFLIDVSGSMRAPNKLPLLQASLALLAAELHAGDRVGIVAFAARAAVLLPSTPGDRQQEILEAIEGLVAGGGTNGAAGLLEAYAMARDNRIPGGVNRVILATDGDFNTGPTTEAELLELIAEDAGLGIELTALGVGTGDLKDDRLELLSGRSGGNYFYLDRLAEARRVLVEQVGGTLVTIAADVKIQVEFNPAEIGAYRLIGYENRALRKEQFDDDAADAGEIGSGHTVTALYELMHAGQVGVPVVTDELKYQQQARPSETSFNGEAFTVRVRYRRPKQSVSELISVPAWDDGVAVAAASRDFKFAAAVAEFGMLLRRSTQAGDASWRHVRELAIAGRDADVHGRRREFLELLERAARLAE